MKLLLSLEISNERRLKEAKGRGRNIARERENDDKNLPWCG
jgi:hypothetical protein